MSKHAALDRFGRSGNPLIRSDLFNQTALDNEDVTTLDGAVNKTAILLGLTVSTAAISWNFQGPTMGLISGIGMFAAVIASLATYGLWIFRWIIKPTPHRAPYTAPSFIYAMVTGSSFSIITDTGLMGIGFSLLVVAIAALNLVLDFDIIEQAAENRTPKYMEWFGAMALVATLIWLYLEILRLLAKLRS